MTSEQINELAAALAAAQSEMTNAAKNETNPHFKKKYADLAAVRDATIPALTKHGLALFQLMTENSGGMMLETTLAHSSGQWIKSVYPIPASGRPQEVGSAITYARRYSWQSICGVAAEEDDDGNAAQAGHVGEKNGNGNGRPPRRTQQEITAAKQAKEAMHDEFERELAECDNLVALARFEKAWAPKLSGEGGHIWTMQEKLERRRLELQAPVEDEPDADGVLPPQTRAEYIQQCHEMIASQWASAASLRTWWTSEAAPRRRFSLSQPEVDDLKARVLARTKELDAPKGSGIREVNTGRELSNVEAM